MSYGVFSVGGGPRRVGLAIEGQVLDVSETDDLFAPGTLEPLLAAGPEVWRAVREKVGNLASSRNDLIPLERVQMHLPCRIGDFVDFYSSIDHARNVGKILRPNAEPLLPNWRQMPIGYHGRAGTIVVDGTPLRRPSGQRGLGDFGPTRRLDFELEVGFLTGRGPSLGTPVRTAGAENYIFGLVLLNDWSARDIQAWEYQPLGPFLGKSFATTISPWVVPLADLEEFRVDPPIQQPEPLPYMLPAGQGLDVDLEVSVNGEAVTRSNLRHLYWTMSQQVAHVTSNGATFGAGDLFASGTVSGPTPDSRGCLLEINGLDGPYLADGDTVQMTARAGDVFFGSCAGTVHGFDTNLEQPLPR
ncbi:MAG: fumarylacetoacetate hydrolase family protein [Actinomycetota bacterium]